MPDSTLPPPVAAHPTIADSDGVATTALPRRLRRLVAGLVAALLAVLGLATFVAPADPAGAATPTVTATDTGLVPGPAGIPALARDCGLSTKLSDGVVLWLFCDSFYTSNLGTLHASLSNSAGFASPWSPTQAVDHTYTSQGEVNLNASATAPGGVPFINLPTSPASFPCDTGIRKAWPTGVVTVPKAGPGGTDKVLVWYLRVCDDTTTYGSFHFVGNGVGLAEYDYTIGSFNPAVGVPQPLVATTLLNDTLFPSTQPYGEGALLSTDSTTVYVYRCDGTGCYVGRAPVGQVATASAYTWWNGSSWNSTQANAKPMSVPGNSLPTAQVTVQYVPALSRYVMTYSPCISKCLQSVPDQLAVRTSLTPQGPWTAPTVIGLPGCTTDTTVSPCRAGAGHVEQSTSSLAVTWWRSNEGAAPSGRLHTGTVPFAAVNALTLDADVPTTTNQTTATFTFGAAGSVWYECSVDGRSYATCSSPTTLTGLAQGNHSFAVRGVSLLGVRTYPQTRPWTVDRTVPTAKIGSKPAAITPTTTATFTFAGTDTQTTASELRFECSVDAAAFSACTSPVTTEALVPGDHTFTVRSVDKAGNRSTGTTATWAETFVVTTTPPAAATLGTAYTGSFATNASALGPVTYAVTAGSLPPGLSLAADGTMSGAPTASGTFGPATVTATASWGTASTNVTITVTPSITGTVRNAVTTTPVAGIRVQAFASNGVILGTTYTLADGTYQLGNLPSDTYRLSFWDPTGGYVTQYWSGQSSLATATGLPVVAGTTSIADVNLAPLLAITGTVTDRLTGAALGSIRVGLYNSAGTAIAMAYTAADGTYRFTGLTPGPYRLAFTDTTGGHGIEYWTQATSLGAATPIGTSAGGTAVADEAMLPLTKITGVVTDKTTGAALSGMWVRLFDANGTAIGLASTNSSGGFTFANLVPGTYRVSFVDPSATRTTQYWVGSNTLTDATPLVATGGTITANGTL